MNEHPRKKTEWWFKEFICDKNFSIAKRSERSQFEIEFVKSRVVIESRDQDKKFHDILGYEIKTRFFQEFYWEKKKIRIKIKNQ